MTQTASAITGAECMADAQHDSSVGAPLADNVIELRLIRTLAPGDLTACPPEARIPGD
jgi:hypothetical protein